MSPEPPRCPKRVTRAGTLCLAALAASTQAAETKYRFASEAAVSASTDPLLTGASDPEALLFEATIRPGIAFVGATGSSVEFDGSLSGRRYSRLYGDYVTGSAGVDATYRESERLTVIANADYERDVAVDLVTEAIGAVVDPQSVRNLYSLGARIEWRPDAITEVTSEAGAERSTFDSRSPLGRADTLSTALSYGRRLDERTRVGLRSAASLNTARLLPDFTRLALLATASHALSARWTIDADAGIERVRSERATIGGVTFPKRTDILFSGQARLCGEGERANGCLTAGLESENSAFAGPQRRLLLGAHFIRQLGPRHSISASVDYQRSSSRGRSILPTIESARAAVRLDRRLSRATTLSGFAEYLWRDLGTGRAADAGVVGIRLIWEPRS